MKKIMIVLALLVSGCGSEEEPKLTARRGCDYCKIEQIGVRAFPCDKCQGMHWSCPLERQLIRMGWDHGWIVACPQK